MEAGRDLNTGCSFYWEMVNNTNLCIKLMTLKMREMQTLDRSSEQQNENHESACNEDDVFLLNLQNK